MAYIPPSDRSAGERPIRAELVHLLGQTVVFEGVQSSYRRDNQGRMRYICLKNVFVYPFVDGEDCTKQPCVAVDHLWHDLIIDDESESRWEVDRGDLLQPHQPTYAMGVVEKYRRSDGSWDYGVKLIRGYVIVGKLLCNRDHLLHAARALEAADKKTAFFGISPKRAKTLIDKTIDYMVEVHNTYNQRIFGQPMANREWRRCCRQKRTRNAGLSAARGFGHA